MICESKGIPTTYEVGTKNATRLIRIPKVSLESTTLKPAAYSPAPPLGHHTPLPLVYTLCFAKLGLQLFSSFSSKSHEPGDPPPL